MRMLAVRMTRRRVGLDGGIRHGISRGVTERRGAGINNINCINSRRAHGWLGRHERIQHDRCVIVVCRRSFVRIRTACVVRCELTRILNDASRYGHRCGRCSRCSRCRGCRGCHRGRTARSSNRADHGRYGRSGGRRRRRIGRTHAIQRRPLRGAGFDGAQRVVNARRGRDRLRGLLHPCIERRACRRRWRGAAARSILRLAAGTGADSRHRARRRARRRRANRTRRDRGAWRGRLLQRGRGRSRGGRLRPNGLEPGRQRGRTGARDLCVRGGAREAGGAAGRRGRHCARRARCGRCRHPAGRRRLQPARRRDRLRERARRWLAARLRPGLRIGFPHRRARIPAVLPRRHRVDGMGGRRLHEVVVAVQRAARQIGDAAHIVVVDVARELDAERRVDPRGELPPADAGQPRQAREEQHDHRDRRADRAEHVREAVRERVAERIRVGARQRARQCAARDEHGREAQPQANRAAAGEAAATGQHRLNETPEQKEEPDGGDAEPAEDNRVHALMKQEEGGERGARPAEFNRPTNRTLMQHEGSGALPRCGTDASGFRAW